MNFNVHKWNKQRYLAEAGLQESIPQKAATAIDKILDEIDPSGILPEELGEAIAIIVKKGYQAELQERFMDALHKKLGYPKDLNEAKELSSYKIGDKVEFPNGEIWKVTKPGVKYDKVFLAPFNDIAKKGHISIAIEFTADELKDAVLESLNEAKDESYMISKSGNKSYPHYVLEKPDGSKQIDMMFDSPEEAKKYANKNTIKVSSKTGYNMNEAKDEFYPDSPEALRQATQTAKEILEKNRDSIKIIADKYKGQRGKSREMMDELDALIDADLEGIAFQEYVSDKVKGVLGKALFRYYASQNPELSKIMR